MREPITTPGGTLEAMTFTLDYYSSTPRRPLTYEDVRGRRANLTAAGFEALQALARSGYREEIALLNDALAEMRAIVLDLAGSLDGIWALTTSYLPKDGRLDCLLLSEAAGSDGGVTYLSPSDLDMALRRQSDLQRDEVWTFIHASTRLDVSQWARQRRVQLDATALFDHLDAVDVCFEYCGDWPQALLFARPSVHWRERVELALERFAVHRRLM